MGRKRKGKEIRVSLRISGILEHRYYDETSVYVNSSPFFSWRDFFEESSLEIFRLRALCKDPILQLIPPNLPILSPGRYVLDYNLGLTSFRTGSYEVLARTIYRLLDEYSWNYSSLPSSKSYFLLDPAEIVTSEKEDQKEK